MIVNGESLDSLFKGYNASFQKGFGAAQTQFRDVAMVVPSATRENEYAWLGQFSRVREWVGDRVIKGMTAQGYKIRNRTFENTVSVLREDIEDDQFGIYGPMMEEMGRTAAELPDELVFDLLQKGFTTQCYDGQYFFDTDHPVGTPGTTGVSFVANTDGGTGPMWFLIDDTRTIRPIVYQERRPFTLVARTEPNDDKVFMRREYIYGTDGRCNAGYGFWQLAWGSKQPLTPERYAQARTAMAAMRGDGGRLLGLRPSLLVVSLPLETDARRLLNSELIGNGESNPWKGSAKLLVSQWLS